MIIRTMVLVDGDTNDGDNIHKLTKIHFKDEGTYIPLIKKVGEAIKNVSSTHSNNWPNNQYSVGSHEELYDGILTEEEIETFNSFVPHGEYGVHTIDSIRLIKYVEDKKIL